MEFNELIEDFATRHGVENLVAVDGAVALDIDGIVVTIVVAGDVVSLSADIGEAPVEGRADFADLLLEASIQSNCFFAKAPESETYVIVRRLSLAALDSDAFDAALEALVNQAETWRRILADFRPAAKAAAAQAASEGLSFGAPDFMQV